MSNLIHKNATCRHCSIQFTYKVSLQKGFFCSRICASKFKVEQDSKKRFELGIMTERATIRKQLTLRDGYSCAECKISDWNGKQITLQVDHIDHNPGNNMPTNLRLLCPNCHTQTTHYGAKNKGKGRKALGLPTR